MTKKGSLISIDILRAVAALGVFFYHQHMGSYLAKYTGVPILGFLDNFGATYAVPLFFLISGYCIHLSNLKYVTKNEPLPLKAYYKRRFLRIYPPYLFALIFAIAVNYFTYGKTQTITDFIVHIFVLQGFTVSYFNTINIVLWNISIELAFYMIYPLFYYLRVRLSLNKALLFSLIVSCISITLFSLKGTVALPERFCVTNLWFAWCCGAYIADITFLGDSNFKKPVFVTIYLAILAATVCLNYIPNHLSIVTGQLHILLWAAPLVILVNLEDWFVKHNNFLIKTIKRVGLSGYSLYLLHQPLIILKNYLIHSYISGNFQFAGMIAGILITPVICWYSFILIEKPFIVKKRSRIA